MSVLNGGIFSRPRGKTGGIVFGSARTRQGKLVTSRLLVPPSNPNTAAQQEQRGKFAEAIAIVRLLGASIYQTDWNRAIGQLPGFQSLTSTYLNSMDGSFAIGVIPPINLGALHMSDTFSAAPGGGAGEIDLTFSTENGLNGTPTDVLVVAAVAQEAAATPLQRSVVTFNTATRGDGTFTLTGLSTGLDYNILAWFEGTSTAEGLLSPTVNDASAAT